MKSETPIIMAAFGTTTKALATYTYMHEKITKEFPENKILWSYSSRMVKDKLKKKNDDIKHPHQVLEHLHRDGHTWAVVQSLHLMCGHEFYRLIDEANSCHIRHAMGLPLLSSPDDYMAVCKAFKSIVPEDEDQALLLVGHGTDHPNWTAYSALTQMIQDLYGNRIFVGVVEEYPGTDYIINKIIRAGIKKVTLAPLMLVAGIHFFEDLIGEEEDTWKSILESAGVEVSVIDHGIGYNDAIIDIYTRHMKEALDAVPYNTL